MAKIIFFKIDTLCDFLLLQILSKIFLEPLEILYIYYNIAGDLTSNKMMRRKIYTYKLRGKTA